MSSTYLSPSLNFYKHAHSNNKLHIDSVGVSEVSVSFLLFSALFAGLLLQQTLHTYVCFTSCNHSDPSVLVAGKSCSWTEILENTSAHLEKHSF